MRGFDGGQSAVASGFADRSRGKRAGGAGIDDADGLLIGGLIGCRGPGAGVWIDGVKRWKRNSGGGETLLQRFERAANDEPPAL